MPGRGNRCRLMVYVLYMYVYSGTSHKLKGKASTKAHSWMDEKTKGAIHIQWNIHANRAWNSDRYYHVDEP